MRKTTLRTTFPGRPAANDPVESATNQRSNAPCIPARIGSLKTSSRASLNIRRPQPIITPPSTALTALASELNAAGFPSKGQRKRSKSQSQTNSVAGCNPRLAIRPVTIFTRDAACSHNRSFDLDNCSMTCSAMVYGHERYFLCLATGVRPSS